jgi:hypothetical protein
MCRGACFCDFKPYFKGHIFPANGGGKAKGGKNMSQMLSLVHVAQVSNELLAT